MNAGPLLRILVWVYCLSWAFDYRAGEGETGGGAAQFLMFGLALACSLGVAMICWRKLFVMPTGWLTLLWGAYLISTFVVAYLNHVPWGNYIRNMSPIILVQASLIVATGAASYGLPMKDILTPTVVAGIINGLWKMFYQLVLLKRPLELIRIELLSAAHPFLLALLMLALVVRPKIPWFPILAGSVAITAYLISITRSVIFIILAAMAGCVFALYRSRRLGLLQRGFGAIKARHALLAVGFVVFAAVLAVAISPTVYERWGSRLFSPPGGEQTETDPSALTRLAEVEAFGDIMEKSKPLSYVYGMGQGHPYYWDESYFHELAYTYYIPDLRDEVSNVWFPGHSIWTYAFFTGGYIGLGFNIAIFVLGFWICFRATYMLRRAPEFGAEHAFIPLVGLLAYFSQSLTFNPFLDRTGGIVLGLILGMPQFLYYQVWKNQRSSSLAAQPESTWQWQVVPEQS